MNKSTADNLRGEDREAPHNRWRLYIVTAKDTLAGLLAQWPSLSLV